ncbi:DUF397 domain-containing protein [Streptomyces calidiresistens]|uniref:DUF397 domain-containing protein n=1 Tax=Streptomyces calidiresistens TaxID=1485586 RepID=A0A7W3T4I9_9ACTN|nr:DUF397 domain-containing protein [Streptomyces calidiresistens]
MVETGWVKSSHSGQNGDCVEVRREGTRGVGFRDSKCPDGPVMVVGHESGRRFLAAVARDGELGGA